MLPQHLFLFEISTTDFNMVFIMNDAPDALFPKAFEFEGIPVLTNVRAAEIFEVETREVTQNLKTNPEKFDHYSRRYAFELTSDEAKSLRSAGLIPNLGRGGSRALPWLLTRKGVLRLATIMRAPKAIEAVDIFIDVFDEVAQQLTVGQTTVEIAAPSRVVLDQDTETFRQKLFAKMQDLLDTVIIREDETTIRDAIEESSRETLGAVQAYLAKGRIQNDKTAAETKEILARVSDIIERRASDLRSAALEQERAAIQIARDKLELLRDMIAMSRDLEPSVLAQINQEFVGGSLLPSSNLSKMSE